MTTPPTTGEYIPGDLITEVLLRLPVKPLLRCKSVSKLWLSLISNPKFIKSHIKHTRADETLIFKGDDHSLSLFHLDSCRIQTTLDLPFLRGDYSFDPHFQVVGSCNGLVCVSVGKLFEIDNPSIYLWNPATKQSKLIPPQNIRDRAWSALGFGFDPIGNDYKVVRIAHLLDTKPKPRSSEVYSANTNVWQNLKPDLPEDCDYFPEDAFINVPEDFSDDDEFDVCVNGFLCCLGHHGLMFFNLNTEVFTIGVHLPASCFDGCFTDFNDTIAFITSEENDTFNLCTLDDEACLRGGKVEASWTLMLSVDVDYSSPRPRPRPRPRLGGYFNNGDFVLYTEDDICLLYNSHKKEARNTPVLITIGRKIIKYNESLVSISGSKQVEWNAHEDDS